MVQSWGYLSVLNVDNDEECIINVNVLCFAGFAS